MELGKYIQERESYSPLKILVKTPRNPGKVLTIDLNLNSEKKFDYTGVTIQEFRSDHQEKYLYRRGSSRGSDITLSAILIDPSTTFNNKILGWFQKKWQEKAKTQIGLSEDEISLLKTIHDCLELQGEKIISDLKEAKNKITSDKDQKKKNILVTLNINDNKSEYLIGEHTLMKSWLKKETFTKYYKKYGTESKSQGKCYFCNVEKEVYGFVTDLFPFYTMDKKTFAPDLDIERAWSGYPVCSECVLYLEIGKEFLEEYMRYIFYGHRYFLIPKFLLPPTQELVDEFLDIFRQKTWEAARSISIDRKGTELRRITNDENEILEILSEESNAVAFTFLFVSKPQASQMVIDLVIPDILPSRLHQIYQAKEAVENISFLKGQPDFLQEFTFGVVRNLFPSTYYDKAFLEITRKIFTNKFIDEMYIISQIMRVIRSSAYDREGRFNLFRIINHAIEGIMLIYFLNELGILTRHYSQSSKKTKRGVLTLSKKYQQLAEQIKDFFSTNGEFFDSPAKRACFLTGLLTRRLMDIQNKERGSMPFWNKLNALRLNETHIKALLGKIIQKLKEYDANYPSFGVIEQLAGEDFIAAGSDWHLPEDITSFYFVVGMTQGYAFGVFKKDQKTEDTE